MNEMQSSDVRKLGFFWHTQDPFLFCVHHKDDYPAGNGAMGPAVSLQGRYLGNDFTLKDGWRMYHGESIPGFPSHPHRGFETVTIVLDGFVDHSDSHGAAGRYGNGDVQWMTAGSGLQHSEMFPLINTEGPNPLELFQIWINLPKAKKFTEPHYKMLWAEDIPVHNAKDNNGKTTEIRIFAGKLAGVNAPSPAPDSWAAAPENLVNIWLIKMQPNAKYSILPEQTKVTRTLYYYKGSEIQIAESKLHSGHCVDLAYEKPIEIQNGSQPSFLLFLQGKPIEEAVAKRGPFVMNTEEEIQQAYDDFQRTKFGGWPWPKSENVHAPNIGRFARYANGETVFKK